MIEMTTYLDALRRESWSDILFRFAKIVKQKIEYITSDHRRRELLLFEETIREYDNLIVRLCLSFSKSREDFEDLRQDIHLNIWKGLDKFNEKSSLSTWIYRVALNTCVSYQRKSKRRDVVSLDELYRELYDNSDSSEIESYKLMYEMIGELRPIDRSIIMMWLDDKSYDEIAGVIGLTRNGIATRLKRAKAQLCSLCEKNEVGRL